MSTLVLITGTGRSGTSTMSGAFHHLGLHVPGPYLGANESNPKGFFESRWAVRFHKQITEGASIHEFDSRPEAFDLAQAAVTDELRAKLRGFLSRETNGHDQVVVKDPRSVWTQEVWRAAAAELGVDIRYISMLRHPAEVVGSRTTYYAHPTDQARRRSYETFNVARWINGSLVSERETRGQSRAFVSYVDLLTDWRPVLTGLADDLGLHYDVDVAGGAPSAVDDFIDPGLRRHRVTWDDLEVPDALREIAEQVWSGLLRLQAAHGTDDAASAGLDEQAERYRRLFSSSADIAHDAVESERQGLRPRGSARDGAPSAAPAPKPAPAGVDGMPVGQVGGRDLVKVVLARAGRKVGRLRRTRG
ncbi:sulfotransferase family protein [Nocardioides cynanchi]|uniref:sulfotransferase family protein n=1 Tax=Nocardioides cynanchi TaxID=2558918 RepID=UPI0012472193|nr:hypothetical protein [Nocardioides cynanchi]